MQLTFGIALLRRSILICMLVINPAWLVIQSTTSYGAAAVAVPKISGTIKALKGPAGEIVAVVEINASKEAMVYFKNVAGPLKGTTKIYKLNEMASDSKDVFYSVKRGSKTKDINVLTLEHGAWTFINPGKDGDTYPVYFSDKETAKIKESDFFSTLKP
jgi:hypothetical protein